METRFGNSRLDTLATAHTPRRSMPTTASLLDNSVDSQVLVFDACQVGVILRAVLIVQLILVVGTLYVATDLASWLRWTATLTGGALPATLLWLITSCALKRALHRLRRSAQWAAGVGLGALAGLYGCGMLVFIGFVQTGPWLASALTGMLLAAALVAVLEWRAQQKRPASAAARLSELQSRIRPHFLFNTLNSAIALVRDEPAKAEQLLEDLSELFRSALVDQGDAVELSQEIELAKRYLAIEEVRFGGRLRATWAIDDNCLKAKLPPLILQPLVENAVKHGVEPSASGADIKISAQKRGAAVVIKITNTAPAGQGQAGHGIALRNVQERLGLLHDVQSSFRCTFMDGIYQVRMEVPV